jgi:hypothetical protein
MYYFALIAFLIVGFGPVGFVTGDLVSLGFVNEAPKYA